MLSIISHQRSHSLEKRGEFRPQRLQEAKDGWVIHRSHGSEPMAGGFPNVGRLFRSLTQHPIPVCVQMLFKYNQEFSKVNLLHHLLIHCKLLVKIVLSTLNQKHSLKRKQCISGQRSKPHTVPSAEYLLSPYSISPRKTALKPLSFQLWEDIIE